MESLLEDTRKQLMELAEPTYRDFSAGLLPGTENILGVRLPALRRMAKQLSKGDWAAWLEEFGRESRVSFEETMLAGMIIGGAAMPLEERFERIKGFLSRVDNWSICDSLCVSIREADSHREKYWAFLEDYFSAREEFFQRFAFVMATDHFLTSEYITLVLDRLDDFSHPGYYAKMAAAWALSICYVKFPEETFPRLCQSRLDDFTFQKALQKICESRRVDDATRAKIRNLKRRTL